MTKDDAILAAMAAGDVSAFTPVQVQKLLFLLDKKAAPALGGPLFDFRPYDYGPFDREVYDRLDELAASGLVDIAGQSFKRDRHYSLTQAGLARGQRALDTLPAPVKSYMQRLSRFVTSLSFVQLVSAIYGAYPEMRVNSVFED